MRKENTGNILLGNIKKSWGESFKTELKQIQEIIWTVFFWLRIKTSVGQFRKLNGFVGFLIHIG